MRISERILSTRNFRRLYTFSMSDPCNQTYNDLQDNNLVNAIKLYNQNLTSQNPTSWNKTLAGYIQRGHIEHAKHLFDKMPVRNIVSWNTMMSAFSKTKNAEGVYTYFVEMARNGLVPNEYTISIALSGVLDKIFSVLVPQIHARAVCLTLNLSVFVGSALIRGYANVGDQMAMRRVFDEILMKDVTSWNALVSGYMELGCLAEAQGVFEMMPEKNIVSWTILVNGFIGNKRMNKARSFFNKMTVRNVVSWTVMISGYVQNGRFVDALKLFRLMVESEIRPNHFTFSSVLDACAGCSSLVMGRQVHSSILKSGIPDDVILLTSLVDMYAKCGDVDAAFCIFESMERKNLVSWNSIIGCYARHGLGTRALEEFDRMISSGVRPDEVTFVNVLSACGHAGLVEEGEKHLKSMEAIYGVKVGLEHYTCMVDLYGRAGQLDKAEEVIKEMPYEPDVFIWGAFLGGYGLHSELEHSEFAVKAINKLKKDHPVAYSMLSKINGERGEWSDIVELRKQMKERQIENQKAGSWI